MENQDTERKIITAMEAILVGAMVVILALLISIIFQFGIVGSLITSWVLTTAYAIFGFFLIGPAIKVNPVRFIEKQVIQEVIREVPVEVEKEVIREIQIPVENKTIEVVEKPVIHEVIRYVDKPAYFTETKARLNIKKYNFMGSTQTKTYHKRNCKFSKMLKKKYKLQNDSKSFFKRKHYKACKTCINNKK